jgi:hypothetical protein
VNFKLGQGGEEIGLFDAAGRRIDAITFGALDEQHQQGRFSGWRGVVVFHDHSTPRAPNTIPGAEPIEIVIGDGDGGERRSRSFGRPPWAARIAFSSRAAWPTLPAGSGGDVPAVGNTASKERNRGRGCATRFYRVLRLP